MPSIERLKKLPGTKTTSKKPVVSEISMLVKELQSITMAQQESQAEIAGAIKQLSQVVLAATKEGFDVSAIVEAISGLKEKVATKSMNATPLDYEINFERDKFGLMKSGIKLNSVPRRLN